MVTTTSLMNVEYAGRSITLLTDLLTNNQQELLQKTLLKLLCKSGMIAQDVVIDGAQLLQFSEEVIEHMKDVTPH